jgi:proteic killer suppression protein
MKITFIDTQMEALCKQSKLAVKALGPLSAKKLHARLTELFNANSVAELIVGAPHPLKGNRQGDFAVSLHGGDRLVFQADNKPVPVRSDGSIDWSAVTEVIIIEVGNYHD